MADIEDNEFHINQNNHFRQKRPDNHTLIVYDQRNVQVLHIRYLNPRAVKVLGTFHCPDHASVVVLEDSVSIGGKSTFGRWVLGNKNGKPLLSIGP